MVAATLFTGLATTQRMQAEGSRELTPNTTGTTAALNLATNTRAGYLTHDFNNIVAGQYQSQGFLKPAAAIGTGRPFAAGNYRMLVRLKPNEVLYYGVHRMVSEVGSGNQADLILTLKYDDAGTEAIAVTNTLPRNTGSTRQSLLAVGPGVINNAAQAAAGPAVAGTASATTGYNPLTYTNTTGAERDFWVEFTQMGEATMTQTQKVSQYDFWDFTVRTSALATGQEVKGRLRSKFWSFTTGAFNNRLSATFSLFPLVQSVRQPNTYYVKQVELAGMNPYAFYFVSNAKGTDATATDFTVSRQSQTTEKTYPEYENFINNPDPSIWVSAPFPVFSRTVQPFCNPVLGRGSAAFTTTSEEAGSTSVLIDINNNGVQDGNDVVIEQTVNANVPTTVLWNGLDAAGNTVATGTTLRLTFISNGAPVNFPLFDVEGNPDGLRVQNIRPSQGGNTFYDRLYWDDRNLTAASATRFPVAPAAPDVRNNRPDGVISTNGVHRWTGSNTGQGGDAYTVNTWTYGFISAAAEQVYSFTFDCDFDKDGVADKDDKDDDNDGIADLTESYGVNPQTQTKDGAVVTDGTGVLVYLDAAYVTPGRGAWRDRNNDGINDLFDVDLDGIPNHLDLDADGDGIVDAREASADGVQLPATGGHTTNGRIATITDTGAGGATAGNGMDDRYESGTSISLTDTDGDGVPNYLDMDSDNDGIMDTREAQTTAAYTAVTTDTDGDGVADPFDPSSGSGTNGTSLAPVNSESDGEPDYRDTNSDSDVQLDWVEGFDENKDGAAMDDLNRKALAFAAANPGREASYPIVAGALSPFLADADSDGKPNFLDPQSTYYHDDNSNGLVDLYDPAYGGTPSIAPRRTTTQTDADFRTTSTVTPLPVELLSFQARAAGRDALLAWATASEKDNARFDVERSADGVIFAVVGSVRGNGTRSTRTDYAFTDKGAGAAAGTRYYRLRQVDLDGKESATEVRVVSFDGKGAATLISVYPSPSTDKATLDLLALSQVTYQVEVLGADGRRMLRFETTGGREVALPVAEFAKGTYLIRVSGQGQRYLVKLLKN